MKMINELRAKVQNLEKELGDANKHIALLSDITGGPQQPNKQDPESTPQRE
jgi:regulator of replication initiation timing